MGLITEEQDGVIAAGGGLGRRTRVESDEAEITLGMRSLLGIFFGLVLICGIFFGLGYSVGRSGGSRVAGNDQPAATSPAGDSSLKKPSAQQSLTPAPSAATSDAGENGDAGTTTAAAGANPPATPPAEQANASAANPQPANGGTASAGSLSSAPANPTANQASPAAKASAEPAPATVHPAPTVAEKRTPVYTAPVPAAVPQRAVAPGAYSPAQPAMQSAVPAAPSTAGSFMVQIAAVRMQQDANVLVGALQRRGYTVVVRREPQDALLHVQIGPFSSRTQAFQMRSRLLADGYNAVVK